MRVTIAGGGIGGMVLALSLEAAGITDVDVYESASAIRQLGVGINILPHSVRELTELGLLDDLLATGIPTSEFVYYSKHGQLIWSEPLGLANGYRWPQISIHRGALLSILHQAVRERLGPERIHTGHHLVDFGQDEHGRAWATFVDRSNDKTVARVESNVLVACDGIHSAVRRILFPHEGPPKWNGVTMWRGVTVGQPFLSGHTMINAGSSQQRVVVYPISKSHEYQGQALINWVANLRTAGSGPMPTQDWTYAANRAEVLDAFASFDFEFLSISELIRGAEAIYQYPMVDRDPLQTWDFDRVTLLGDAAHPMHPVGGNGASQAIIDARVLARELALQPSVADAIGAYERERRPATAAVVQSNRRAGPHRCQDLVEERAPDGFNNLHDVVSQQELTAIADEYKQIAGFDVDRLNNQPSRSVR